MYTGECVCLTYKGGGFLLWDMRKMSWAAVVFSTFSVFCNNVKERYFEIYVLNAHDVFG